MSQEVRGVVARDKGKPVSMERIVVPDPGPGEAVVAVAACGVCHTDLLYREGAIVGEEFPFLLGHEAAGTVEAVGPDVTSVAPGDFVILNWRGVCGDCRACRQGEPWYCFDPRHAGQRMTLADGTELSPALGIGALAEKTLVAAEQCTAVATTRPEVACLLGCGVMTGLGAAMNTGGVRRGDSVAVFGCGGVGCAAVAGARLAGATVVIAVDRDDRKLAWATDFGATHTINSTTADPVEAIRELTGGFGVNVTVEAAGRPETYRNAFYARDRAGTMVFVGVAPPELTVELPLIDILYRGGAVKPSWYGDCLPSRDFPMLIDLYRQGRLDLDRFVTETIGLDEVEEAFARMHGGDVLRSVVVL